MTRSLVLATLAAAAALTFAARPAHAVPETLGLTARVVDAGVPLAGNHSITVRLHTAATGGNAAWSETQTAAVTDGLLYLTLGAQTPLTSTVVDGGPLYAEIQIDSTVLAPRLAVTSTAYAIRAAIAEDSERLGGQPATAFAAANHNHNGAYLPVGSFLACASNEKVASINPTTGSLTCAPDNVGPTYVAGPGISIAGTQLAVMFGGTGTLTSAARSDHAHTGVYLPIGSALTCPAGQFATAIQANGNPVCALEAGDITQVTAGTGLTGGAASGGATLAVAFAGLGVSTSVARADHFHPAVCPTGYATHASAGAATPLCVKRVAQANVTYYDAATACYVQHQAGELCTYAQLRVAFTTTPQETQVVNYWMADRVDDDWVLRVNSSANDSNFDEKIEIASLTVTGPGYYCCQRAQ